MPSVDVVDEVGGEPIVYSGLFKENRMRQRHVGEGSYSVFADAGLPPWTIGCQRIERAICR